jgi:hypothetical protein
VLREVPPRPEPDEKDEVCHTRSSRWGPRTVSGVSGVRRLVRPECQLKREEPPWLSCRSKISGTVDAGNASLIRTTPPDHDPRRVPHLSPDIGALPAPVTPPSVCRSAEWLGH